MAETEGKRNYMALTGMILGIVASFTVMTPLTPILPAAALVISIAGIIEARKTDEGLAYAVVGFILGLFVLGYYFFS